MNNVQLIPSPNTHTHTHAYFKKRRFSTYVSDGDGDFVSALLEGIRWIGADQVRNVAVRIRFSSSYPNRQQFLNNYHWRIHGGGVMGVAITPLNFQENRKNIMKQGKNRRKGKIKRETVTCLIKEYTDMSDILLYSVKEGEIT